MEVILGVFHQHTENSGYGIVVKQIDEFIEIKFGIMGHCATSKAEIIFYSKGKETLTSNDLRKIGNMFLEAANKSDDIKFSKQEKTERTERTE